MVCVSSGVCGNQSARSVRRAHRFGHYAAAKIGDQGFDEGIRFHGLAGLFELAAAGEFVLAGGRDASDTTDLDLKSHGPAEVLREPITNPGNGSGFGKWLDRNPEVQPVPFEADQFAL